MFCCGASSLILRVGRRINQETGGGGYLARWSAIAPNAMQTAESGYSLFVTLGDVGEP